MEFHKIAWIGTGVMGSQQAGHLAKNGYSVSAYTHKYEKLLELEKEFGIHPCKTIVQAVEDADAIFVMVGYPSDVEEVFCSEGGIFDSAKKGALAIDMTTSSPSLAQKLYEMGKERGIRVMDAPVSGGDSGARNATLSIMVGGDQKDFEDAFGITRSTASKVCSLMETKGLIHRQPVSDDARLKKITLTDRGETMRREMIEGRKRMEAKLTAGFSSEELQNLRDYLRRMKENMKR